MKNTAIQTQEELASEEQNQQIDDEHWYLDVPDSIKSKSKYLKNFLIFMFAIFINKILIFLLEKLSQ